MIAQRLRRSWLAPLIFFQCYLSLTVAMFFFGPWPWDVDSPVLLITYLLGAQLCIQIGYLAAWRQVAKTNRNAFAAASPLVVREGVRFFRIAVLVTLILLVPTSLSRTGSAIPDVVDGLTNTGSVYNENVDRLDSGNAFVVVEYVRMALSPLLVAVFPLTLVYWGSLSRRLRAASLFAIVANLSLYIATGTNKGLADLVVTSPWLIYLGVSAGVLRFRISKRTAAIIFIVVFAVFLQYFGAGQAQRHGSGTEFGVFNTGLGILEADSGAVSALLSDNQRIIYESLTRYVVQGYYALSLSFQVDGPSTLGFGHSMFLARNADAIFGTTYFSSQSLPGLIEDRFGWGMFLLWHSIYPWLASDFGYIGSLVVIGLFSYLLALSWGLSLSTLRYRWIIISYLMLILFFYIPANNQVFQTGETCFAFFIVLSSLAISRLRRLRRAVVNSTTSPADTGVRPVEPES